MHQLANAEGLAALVDLAARGRADVGIRTCRGVTWTNIAHRALELLKDVVERFGPTLPADGLDLVRSLRATGVNWICGSEDKPAGYALFNCGTFEFDTSHLRLAAERALEQQAAAPPPPATSARAKQKLAARLRALERPARKVAERVSGTAHLDPIIEEQHELLIRDPADGEPYRALYQLYAHQQNFDAAFCACQALTVLGQANRNEARFYEAHRPRGMLQVKSRLANELWEAHLVSRSQDIAIDKIFEPLEEAALKLRIQQLKAARQAPHLDDRFKQDPASSTVTVVKTLGWAAGVLATRCPEIHVRNDLPESLVAVPARPPVSLAGRHVLTGLKQPEVTFLVGRHISLYRGPHYVKCLFSDPAQLSSVFFAAIRLVRPEASVPEEIQSDLDATLAPLAKNIERTQRDRLASAVHELLERGAEVDLARWSHAVDLTACRAGLLLCGDLGAAWTMINAHPASSCEVWAEEQLKELLLFSMSPEYFILRKALGITIDE